MLTLKNSIPCDESHFETAQDHSWRDHLIDATSVVFRCRGRLRFKLDFAADEMLADTLRKHIHRLSSARFHGYSIRTRTALITFDYKQVDEVSITAALLLAINEYGKLHGDCNLDHHHHSRMGTESSAHGEDCDHDHSAEESSDAHIKKSLVSIVLSGGALAWFVYRRLKGKSPLISSWIPVDLAAIITLASGYRIFQSGFKTIKNRRKPTDDTLISLAVIASLLMRESLTGLSVVWLIQLGRLLESITLKRSRTALRELMDVSSTEAWLLQNENKEKPIQRVDVESVKLGQILRVFQGEKVPLDGTMIGGSASLQESFLTGEPVPKEKKLGDFVYAGSVVVSGEIDIEVTNLVQDTVVATMIEAIENLRDNKAPIERIGNRFASKFVPISILMAGGTFLVTKDLRRSISMLVIACPCAAGLATPTAVSASIGQAAKKGILIKGGTHLETAARINTLVVDKTGTLTEGHPSLDNIWLTPEGKKQGEERVLQWAASAEQYSVHPYGKVLVDEAHHRKLTLTKVDQYEILEGLGIRAEIKDTRIDVGSHHYMQNLRVTLPKSIQSQLQEPKGQICSFVYLSVNQKLLAVFAMRDAIRTDAPKMLAQLRSQGIRRIVLATGDQKDVAAHVSQELGIEAFYGELMPDDKLQLVRKLKAEGRKVAMLGDGVNDAQALAEADLSIAIGASRCDIAIETANVTIARNDLMLVPELMGVSRKTLNTIYQNFAAAVGINAVGTGIGAMGQLSLFQAAIVHNLSTIAVVLNSFRLGKQLSQDKLIAGKEIT